MEKKEILKNIKLVATNGKAWFSLVQDTAIACLEHSEKHHEVSLCIKLVEALPAGKNRKNLAAWFAKHGQMKVNALGNLVQAEKGKIYDIEGATATLWHVEPDKEAATPIAYTLARFEKSLDGALEKALKGDLNREALATKLRSMLDVVALLDSEPEKPTKEGETVTTEQTSMQAVG